MAETSQYIPLKEFGRRVGVGRTRLYGLPAQGLPHIRHGTRIMVKPSEGEAWLQGRPAGEINLKFDEAEMASIKKAADLMGWPLEEFIKTAVAAAIQQLNEVEAA